MTSIAANSAQPSLWSNFTAAMTWRGHSFAGFTVALAGLLLSLAVYAAAANLFEFPQRIIDSFPFADKVNEARDWLEANLKVYTRAIADVIGVPLEWIEERLWELPWVFVLLMLVLPSLAYGGLKLGLLTFIGVMFLSLIHI